MKTKYLKIIDKYFNQQMDESEKRDFEALLKENPALKRELEEYKAVYEAIGDNETMELRKELRKIGQEFSAGQHVRRPKGPPQNFLWIAALLIISLSVISITYMLVNSSITSYMVGMRLGSANITNQLYRLEPAYAEFFRYRIRSEEFQLLSPRDSLVVERKKDITFSWDTDIQGPLFVDVMNKTGRVVFTSEALTGASYVLSRNFHPGIYVYRFRTDHNTLYTGLFYVV